MKLVSLSQRIEDLGKEYLQFCPKEGLEYLDRIISYKDFLKQPLKLEMFLPCDEEGNAMIHPSKKGFLGSQEMQYDFYAKKYKKAQEKVLFKGFDAIEFRDHSLQALKYNLSTSQLDSILRDEVGFYYYNSSMEIERINTVEDLIKYNSIELTEKTTKQF